MTSPRLKRVQFWAGKNGEERLLAQVLEGRKTASAGLAREWHVPEGNFDDGGYLAGDLVEVYDRHGRMRCHIQITEVYETPFGCIPEKLWRGELCTSAEDFQRGHRQCWDREILTDDTRIVAFHFERVRLPAAVRRFETSEWQVYRDLRLRALAESPDAFGSTLVVEQARADEAWESRLGSGVASKLDLPLLALADNEPSGLAWAKVDQTDPWRVNLYQMWVAPGSRGQGLGGLLLNTAIAWARAQGAKEMGLGVTVSNSPALHLYRHAGFSPSGPAESLRPGSDLLSQSMVLQLDRVPG